MHGRLVDHVVIVERHDHRTGERIQVVDEADHSGLG
jgi:hypothetical protein